MNNIPRIRGKVGEAEPGQGHDGKYFFEMSMWSLDEQYVGTLGTWGPFDTEKVAKTKMKEITRHICETIEKQVTGGVSGKYFDLQSGGKFRNWDDN